MVVSQTVLLATVCIKGILDLDGFFFMQLKVYQLT